MQKRRSPRMLSLAAGIGLVALGPITARAASTTLPSLVAPTPTRLPGKMVFAALVTPDLVTAERFYTNLFRWQFHNAYVGPSLFGQATFNGRSVAAIVQRPMSEGQRPAWRSFLSIADVDAGVQTAVQHGASVLVPPHEIANLGRDAVLADPQGAVFGLLSSSSGDPADTLAIPGEWIWSTLVTSDPQTDAAFYKSVLGYDGFDSQDAQDPRHVTLVSQTFARASINPIPADHPISHPRWISYVRVSDMATAVSKATELGGHVVVPAHEDRNGGTIALMADPAGALFGLMVWSDDTASENAEAGDAK